VEVSWRWDTKRNITAPFDALSHTASGPLGEEAP
jgi:hypothetical protein